MDMHDLLMRKGDAIDFHKFVDGTVESPYTYRNDTHQYTDQPQIERRTGHTDIVIDLIRRLQRIHCLLAKEFISHEYCFLKFDV
jgi:hypothetical protein